MVGLNRAVTTVLPGIGDFRARLGGGVRESARQDVRARRATAAAVTTARTLAAPSAGHVVENALVHLARRLSPTAITRLILPLHSHMPSRRRRRARRLATQAVELGFAVPEVVAHRIGRMVLAGAAPSAHEREELFRMSAEKVLAFHEAWNGMMIAAWRTNLRLFLSASVWSPPWPFVSHPRWRRTLQRMAVDILASGMAPIHRRAVANAKRLRK
jgi:hypothetical protein